MAHGIELNDNVTITRADDDSATLSSQKAASLPDFMTRNSDGTIDYWRSVTANNPTEAYISGELRGIGFLDWLNEVGMVGSAALRRIVEDMAAKGEAGSPASLGFFTVIGCPSY
jgi:hypothetical protein